MMLVSTTLTDNREDVIGDAIKSAIDFVDKCLVIDTGVTDQTLQIAREAAGDKYIERKFPWPGDFSAARNFALDAAREAGATWAMTLDSDQRIVPNGEDVRGVLAKSTVNCFMAFDTTGTFKKEQFFRVPTRARWAGPTHEAFPAYAVGFESLERLRVFEVPKTPEGYRKKFERDLVVLSAHILSHPNDTRTHYYLGESLMNLERYEEAIKAYDACASLRGWNEESAWACYRAADCSMRLGRLHEAVDFCARGLSRHSGIAELAWLAALASFRCGEHHQAIYWAKISIGLGYFRGIGKTIHRIGFRHPPALWEGPYDVLRWAHKVLGDAEEAAEAERLYEAARNARG